MTRGSKVAGLLIGASVAAGIYAGVDIHNAIAYNNIREELCDEFRHADFKSHHVQWTEEDWQTCYRIVEVGACSGLANGKTGPHPPMGCK